MRGSEMAVADHCTPLLSRPHLNLNPNCCSTRMCKLRDPTRGAAERIQSSRYLTCDGARHPGPTEVARARTRRLSQEQVSAVSAGCLSSSVLRGPAAVPTQDQSPASKASMGMWHCGNLAAHVTRGFASTAAKSISERALFCWTAHAGRTRTQQTVSKTASQETCLRSAACCARGRSRPRSPSSPPCLTHPVFVRQNSQMLGSGHRMHVFVGSQTGMLRRKPTVIELRLDTDRAEVHVDTYVLVEHKHEPYLL